MTGVLVLSIAMAADLFVPMSYPTVADALEVASPSDTIHIAAGTFPDDITIDVTDLTLQGAGMDQTVLGPGEGIHAVYIREGVSVVLQDLTIDGQGAMRAFGAQQGNGDAVLRRVRIQNSQGVHFEGRNLTIEDSEFLENANTGYLEAAALTAMGQGTVTISGTLFCRNEASSWSGLGGVAIHASHDAARVVTSQFVGNTALSGGGIWVSTDAEVLNNTFLGNEADFGAGIRVDGGTTTLVNNLFVGHTGSEAVENEGSWWSGGGTLDAHHNLYFDNDRGDSTEPLDATDVQADPLLSSSSIDCDQLDLTLLEGSPAIGAGSAADGVHGDMGAIPYEAPDVQDPGDPEPTDPGDPTDTGIPSDTGVEDTGAAPSTTDDTPTEPPELEATADTASAPSTTPGGDPLAGLGGRCGCAASEAPSWRWLQRRR